MDTPLPSNEDVEAFGKAIPWENIENQKRQFNQTLKACAEAATDDALPLEEFADAIGVPVSQLQSGHEDGNVLLAHVDGYTHLLASYVSKRYRHENPLLKTITPYNFNPSVNHTNLDETMNPTTQLRALGAELELGLYHENGDSPDEERMTAFIAAYSDYARGYGIMPTVDREACSYQVEVHIAPAVGYHRTRLSLDGIMKSLVQASQRTGLQTAIFSAYPILSDFHINDSPKVQTATRVMTDINTHFPEYGERMQVARERYNMAADASVVQIFRLQGCHIHLDIAGRSEALGLLTFYTMLRSATAIANAALLKGGPFVNGTCDPELVCTREYLRSTTVTGRYLHIPLTPHLSADGMHRYANLLHNSRANAPARALLCDNSMGEDISVMHNPIGRVRPDLGMTRRVCTVESTGMPVNISASRQAAALTDFEFSHVLVENYFRKHGMDLEPMMADETLWKIIGPLSIDTYSSLQDQSDRIGTDMVLETADGSQMSLGEFYEMKRVYMHKHLIDIPGVTPRDIDEVYMSLNRMLEPPSGRVAETPEQYIVDPTWRSTGNWGMILRNAFIEEGGTPGEHNPDAVLRVANRVHNALVERYS